MTIEKFKNLIESNSLLNGPYIVVDSYKDGLIDQYLDIIRSKNTIFYIDDIPSYVQSLNGFSTITKDLVIYRDKNLDYTNKNLLNCHNLIAIVDKLSDEEKSLYDNFIVDLPKLEEWQIKDYIYSVCNNFSDKYKELLFNEASNNFLLIYNEIRKVSLFTDEEKEKYKNMFEEDNIFNVQKSHTIFECINAILKNDSSSLINLYSSITKEDSVSFLGLLLKSLENVIKVQGCNNPTPEHTGLTQKQIYAIKYNCGYFSNTRLISLYKTFYDIYINIRLGYYDADDIINDIIINIFL